MSDYKKLRLQRFASTSSSTAITRYYDSFITEVYQELGVISNISWQHVYPYYMAISSLNNIHIYDAKNGQIIKKINRNKENVSSLKYRQDGKILASGNIKGQIQLHDISSRIVLRRFRNHKVSFFFVCLYFFSIIR